MIVNVSALPRDVHYSTVVNSENGSIFRDYIKQDVVIYPASYRLLIVRSCQLKSIAHGYGQRKDKQTSYLGTQQSM